MAITRLVRRSIISPCVGAALALLIAPHISAAQELASEAPTHFHPRCGADVHADEKTGFVPFPQGLIFCPLVADPKAVHSFISYLRGDFSVITDPVSDPNANLASVGLGDSFGLFRIGGSTPPDGLQLDLEGGIFAQFNLDEPSFDLINADYLVGLPLTFRARGFSSRLRVYHQSSHLGDEFLLSRDPSIRENFSFESVELIASQEAGWLRAYVGGEQFFRRFPVAVATKLIHSGLEVRPIQGPLRFVASVDVKVIEEANWRVAWSGRTSFEVARIPSPGHPARVVSLLGTFYDGPAPYGQFYRDNFKYWGIGLHFFM
jgi:uncharacterized protein DUF1207